MISYKNTDHKFFLELIMFIVILRHIMEMLFKLILRKTTLKLYMSNFNPC